MRYDLDGNAVESELVRGNSCDVSWSRYRTTVGDRLGKDSILWVQMIRLGSYPEPEVQ